MTPRTVVFAVSHFHNADEVRAFCDHVLTLPRPPSVDVRVGVAENGGSGLDLDDFGSEVFRVPGGGNVGYLGGAHRVFEAWSARHGPPSWLVVSNTDVTFDPGALRELGEAREGEVLAPDVVLPDGRPQNPFLERRYSALRAYGYVWLTRFGWAFGLLARSAPLRRRIRRWFPRRSATDHTGPRTPRTIYAAHGSCIVLPRRFFERGGTLAFPTFMYGEEIHVAEQARRVGCPIRFTPELRVHHAEHSVTGSVPDDRRRTWMHESARDAWLRYYAPAWWPGAEPVRTSGS